MGARLRVFLTAEEDRTLFELRTARTVPQRVKDRAEVVRLNAKGWYVEKIAVHFDWHVDTIREALRRWQKEGLEGLWDAPCPGWQRRWEEAGIWHPLKSFTYGLSIGGFDSESYIKMMDEQAKQAAPMFQQTGRIRVIAQDNGSIHTSAEVRAKQTE
ncbi:MAG: helix-turn-helix domain-containing protein [Aphanocapsa sp. GSE-SYN-MK-11-07L]|jgi:hypothetical protein|nr:helix-turn-helix domain-containing protein [Aphanocapsa sp. GSE-SYN-MK-11-07L]